MNLENRFFLPDFTVLSNFMKYATVHKREDVEKDWCSFRLRNKNYFSFLIFEAQPQFYHEIKKKIKNSQNFDDFITLM